MLDLQDKPNPFGELASAARAVALALRMRGLASDLPMVVLLDRHAGRALMHLAGFPADEIMESGKG